MLTRSNSKMYTNTYAWGQVFWSETRFWIAFVMGAAMAVVMLAFMLGIVQGPEEERRDRCGRRDRLRGSALAGAEPADD